MKTKKQTTEPMFVKLANKFEEERERTLLTTSLSYDDVVVIPGLSVVTSLDQISLKTQLTEDFGMELPIISANMSTVTEEEMALFMAKAGALGIIHRALTIEEQVRQVKRVKKYSTKKIDKTATTDKKGRLRVGAAIGVSMPDSEDRARALIASEVDLLVVDVLHGDSPQVKDIIKRIKKISPKTIIVAGNVATADATRRLIEAGADIVKVGYGDGAMCTTRIKTGTGRPQFSAVVDCATAARSYGKTIIADGSIRMGGDMTKALAGGASTVMIGSLLAGTDQSPGRIIRDDLTWERYKLHRGMASSESQYQLAKARSGKAKKRVAQGISTRVAHTGDAQDVIDELAGGLASGIANAGAYDIHSLQQVARFEKQSASGRDEGNPHFLRSSRVRI